MNESVNNNNYVWTDATAGDTTITTMYGVMPLLETQQ